MFLSFDFQTVFCK